MTVYLLCNFYIRINIISFSLTGKGQLRDVDNIDHEALFIAGEHGDEMYVWNENGYYTAPSKGYERIDMSPKPDKDFPQTRGTCILMIGLKAVCTSY